MDDDGGFTRWFAPWLSTRPVMAPIGWYTKDDLKAAFNAGKTTTDDRPGNPSLPPTGAGPVPAQD